jgi:ribosome-associated protein
VAAARLAAHTRCRDVSVLDLGRLWPVADFFVVATGTSQRQMRSVCDEVEEIASGIGSKAYSRSGYEGHTWIVLDFVDVVVHLFSPEARAYYDLDSLWGDAPRVQWEHEADAAKSED